MEKAILKISIIVPVYNGAKYLRTCIDSLVNQTYHNLQIIIVDDGSKDSTGEILDEYKKTDSRIWVVNQKNQGTSVARNSGIEIANGDYITFVDSDDYLLPDCIEKVVDVINNTTDVDLIVWNSRTFGSGREISSGAIDKVYTGREYVEYILENRCGAGGVWCKAYKTSIIKENNLRFANFKTAEDGHFNTACLQYLNIVVSMSYVGYMYRKEDYYIHSTTKFFSRENFFESSVESASARLLLLRNAMAGFGLDEYCWELYYKGEYYTFEVVNDENAFYNKCFRNKVKCSKMLLENVVSQNAIEQQNDIWCKGWLRNVYKRKSGLGLILWHFAQFQNMKSMIINKVFGEWFPKNSSRGKLLRTILRR